MELYISVDYQEGVNTIKSFS